ncbi:DUF938 domain-containing protein [Yunchengibacter salinarum]|uniref:DUF938 domain-containing protein n=1 Tax=Yunchengibacter salinarum TaxID=3133399 RepID=UPI0035B598EA
MAQFFDPDHSDDGRRHAPAVARNTAPLIETLTPLLPARGMVLEVASGTGEHAAAFARAFPHLTFQPSDRDDEHLGSIRAWVNHANAANLRPPLTLDVTASPWPLDESPAAILAINLMHISPWAVTQALFAEAGRLLSEGAALISYGPYKIDGKHTSDSNEKFDESLKSRDSSWGIRDLDTLREEAAKHGLRLAGRHAMPANNFTLDFRKGAAA